MRAIFSDYTSANRQWVDLSFQHEFLLLVPNGTRLPFLCTSCVDTYGNDQRWNYLPGTDVVGTKANDVGFLLQLVQWAVDNHSIDPTRVYLTGFSNGGMMTFRMLTEYPHIFAAGAAFNANLPDITLAAPASPRPIFIMNGNNDPVVKWQGGTIGSGVSTGVLDGVLRSALATRDWFVDVNGANEEPVTEDLPNADPNDGCRVALEFHSGVVPVSFYIVDGGGHSIPSRDSIWIESLFGTLLGRYCHDVNGVALGWEFLSEFSLPVV